jgi:thiamine biosynthesis protein ThiI
MSGVLLMNEKILMVRCGEVALKGMNKPYFEKMLLTRINKRLKVSGISNFYARRHEGYIFIEKYDHDNENRLINEISEVFGVDSISPAVKTEPTIEALGDEAVTLMNSLIRERNIESFKVMAKRSDKSFPVKSPDIAAQVGAMVLIGCKVLKVDVHEPDIKLYVDIRKDGGYIYTDKIRGFGGLPLGTNGKGLVLFSGGIDSPVAAWMMAKRGMVIEAVHFHSYPYTSLRARQKVEELCEIISSYCGPIKLHLINLLPIQEEIIEKCPEGEMTILIRRFMMRISEKIAEKNRCNALITGESLGQVASQTAEAIAVTDASVALPVLRPLIAMDKIDIMAKAKDIGSYEKSIEPYEDCCTVFLPKHPVTRPRLKRILESEQALETEKLVEEALQSDEIVEIS